MRGWSTEEMKNESSSFFGVGHGGNDWLEGSELILTWMIVGRKLLGKLRKRS